LNLIEKKKGKCSNAGPIYEQNGKMVFSVTGWEIHSTVWMLLAATEA